MSYMDQLKKQREERDSIYEQFDEYKLSDSEVWEAINNGLLSDGIDNILTTKEFSYYRQNPSQSTAFFNSLGVKVAFISLRDHRETITVPSFFVTDFYLICCDKHEYMAGSGERVLYKTPDRIKVIPLERVQYIKIQFNRNTSTSLPAVTKEVKLDPALGAAIGGALGGATGAIVGAAANTGTKTVTVRDAYYNSYNNYDLMIKLKDLKEYKYRDYFQCDGEEDKFDSVCDIANELIQRSKEEKTLEEKRKIVSDIMFESKAKYSKESRSRILGKVVFWTLVFVGVIVVTIAMNG